MKIYYLFVCFVLLTSCKSKEAIVKTRTIKSKSAIHWKDAATISPILYKAEAEGKMVFLDIYTDWCLPCQMMDEDVFTDKKIGDLINKDFISYKVNAEKRNGPDLNFLFQVTKYPTLLFLDARGNELIRKEGAAYHRELTGLIAEAKDIMKAKKTLKGD